MADKTQQIIELTSTELDSYKTGNLIGIFKAGSTATLYISNDWGCVVYRKNLEITDLSDEVKGMFSACGEMETQDGETKYLEFVLNSAGWQRVRSRKVCL